MSVWGLLAQGIQDTIGHIGGLVSGTHPWQTTRRQMDEATQLQQHGMSLDEKNYQHMIDKFNYDKNIQQEMFRREDTAVQRRASDLKAAGINPILAAGQAANAGSPIGVTAPMHHATGAVAGMSAKQQARAMAQDHFNQQRARSVQISQMIAHAQLLHEQAKTERERQFEIRAHVGEMTERTKGYAYVRALDGWRIHEIASEIRVDDAMLRKLNSETSKVSLDTEERRYNFEKAKSLGIRSDVNPTLIGELTQALYALMHARSRFSFENVKNSILEKHPGLKNVLDDMKQDDVPAATQGLLQGIDQRYYQSRQLREYGDPLGRPNYD